MTRPPVIFYFTGEAKEKEDLPGVFGGERRQNCLGVKGEIGRWEGEERRGGK